MSKLLAVVWNVNTHTAAKTTLAEMRDEVTSEAASDPRMDDYLNDLALANSWTRAQAIEDVAKSWMNQANQRDPFTGLSPTARVSILDGAVKAAANWAWKAGSPDVVFVAPEYLFAQSGTRHLLNGTTHLQSILASVQSISKRYPHVLLFPGTIAYREQIVGKSVRARVALFEDMIFWEKQTDPMPKKTNQDKIQKIALRKDGFEMAQNKAYAYLAGEKLLEYTKRGDFHEVTRRDDTGNITYVPGSRSGTLRAFDKQFGIEICLDHNLGYAKGSGGDNFDVHIITSACVEPVAGNEKTVGNVNGKTGFVVHASSSASYTQVVRWASGKREVLPPLWDTGAGHGRLYGYSLDFGVAKQDTVSKITPGKVSSIKTMFGG